jgi:HD-GYP domain-containing protein (c-di-GMP phosphodiesterase class II)
MESGIVFVQNKEYIDAHHSNFSKVQLTSKYKDDVCEINLYIAPKNVVLFVESHITPNSIKTYYIVYGSCQHTESKKILKAGDIIVVKDTKDINSFKMLEETEFLIHARNSELYKRVTDNSMRMDMLLDEIQHKDEYTKEHCERVFKLAQKMALLCQYKTEKFFNINLASKYHDIGKIYIEDTILNKPGKLSEFEFDIMQKHATIGKELITETYDNAVFEIISQHHERIDGTGYPQGLKGEDIMEEARILAICDSFDAMITDRIYKKGKNVEEALGELKSLAGSKYDARLVDIFIKMINDEDY